MQSARDAEAQELRARCESTRDELGQANTRLQQKANEQSMLIGSLQQQLEVAQHEKQAQAQQNAQEMKRIEEQLQQQIQQLSQKLNGSEDTVAEQRQ